MSKLATSAAITAGLVLLASADLAHAVCSGRSQAAMNQAAMNQCAAAKAKVADLALNTTYGKLKRPPELIVAQRAWITFRDAQCRYEASSYKGGSIQPLISSACLERVTQARTAELQQLLKDQTN